MNRFTAQRTWNKHWLAIVAMVVIFILAIIVVTPAFGNVNNSEVVPLEIPKCEVTLTEIEQAFFASGMTFINKSLNVPEVGMNDLWVFSNGELGDIAGVVVDGPCVLRIFFLE